MRRVLPYRFRFAHGYAIMLHDLIVSLFAAANEARVFMVTFDLSPEQRKEFAAIPSGEAQYGWIERELGEEVALQLDYRGVAFGLIRDLCQFVLEGLRASERGKTTVAYTLFRKPFQDNLLLLEWLVADRHEFLDRFRKDGPDAIAPKRRKREKQIAIIAGALEKINRVVGLDASFLHQVRYDKAANFSLAGAADQAVHLVTTMSPLRTENRNFNFVYSGYEEIESQWRNIYFFVPYLLYHTVSVVDAVIDFVADVDPNYKEFTELRRLVGFGLWAEDVGYEAIAPAVLPEAIVNDLRLRCPGCDVEFRPHRRNLRGLVLRSQLRCSVCKETTDIVPVQEKFGGRNAEV